MSLNRPYVKVYDEKGILTNPITKSNPYLNVMVSKKHNAKRPREYSNKKGTQVRTFKTTALKLRKQYIGNKTIVHWRFIAIHPMRKKEDK